MDADNKKAAPVLNETDWPGLETYRQYLERTDRGFRNQIVISDTYKAYNYNGISGQAVADGLRDTMDAMTDEDRAELLEWFRFTGMPMEVCWTVAAYAHGHPQREAIVARAYKRMAEMSPTFAYLFAVAQSGA